MCVCVYAHALSLSRFVVYRVFVFCIGPSTIGLVCVGKNFKITISNNLSPYQTSVVNKPLPPSPRIRVAEEDVHFEEKGQRGTHCAGDE